MADATVSLSNVSAPRKPGLLSRFMLRMIAARAERVVLTELGRLSNRDLNDIGISRGQIREIARKQREEVLAGL